MQILCISDTHTKHLNLKIPNCDVLIISGDICSSGSDSEVQMFAEWLKTQDDKFKKVVLIAGNHDWALFKNRLLCVDILKNRLGSKLEYLEDSEVIIDGIKFYGSPWQPEFGKWAFNVPRGKKLKNIWSNIPDDVDVLITHGPPHGIGDLVPGVPSISVGCAELFNRVRELSRLKLHVFGHIHAGNGVYFSEESPNTYFCNASICNEQYLPINPGHMFNVCDLNNIIVLQYKNSVNLSS